MGIEVLSASEQTSEGRSRAKSARSYNLGSGLLLQYEGKDSPEARDVLTRAARVVGALKALVVDRNAELSFDSGEASTATEAFQLAMEDHGVRETIHTAVVDALESIEDDLSDVVDFDDDAVSGRILAETPLICTGDLPDEESENGQG